MQLVHIFPTKDKVYEIFYSQRGLNEHLIKVNSKVVWNGYGQVNALCEVIRLMQTELNGDSNG